MKQLYREFTLIMRGVGVLHKLAPWNLLAKCIRSICNAAIPFANLYFSAEIIDALVAKRPLKQLLMLVALTLAVNLILVMTSKKMDEINYRKWNEFYPRYNLSIGKKAQSLTYEKIEDVNTHLMIKSLDDAMKIGDYGLIKLHSRIPLFIENMLKVLFSGGYIISAVITKTGSFNSTAQSFVNSYLADAIFVVLIAISAVACIYANKRNSYVTYEHLGRLSKVNRILDFYVNHYLDGHKAGKDIRLYHQNKLILDELNSAGQKSTEIVNDLNTEVFKSNTLITLANFALILYTYLYVGIKSVSGAFAVGSIVKYSGGVLQFAAAFSGTMNAFSQLRANIKYLQDYFDFIDLPSEQIKNDSTIPFDRKRAVIEARNVSFKYPGSDEYILKNVSFIINSREKAAIVGKNGSGKTTLVKLLCRLYEPTDGVILYNGIDIRNYNIDEYRKNLGVVFQDFKLFSFTIGQNVASDVEFDRAQATKCLEKSGFGKRLSDLKDGINSYLYKDFDEHGIEISGGEAQKIALARALYKNPPLIILDEPTSALDPIAEADIYEKFGEIVDCKTSIFISHRLSSCHFCDKILVFADGRIVEQGTHRELLNNHNSQYARLYNAQAKYYNSNAAER